MKRFLKKYVFIFVLSLVFSLFVVNNSYAETTVTTEDQLQTAIDNNDDIVINSNIDITKSIKVPNTYNKTIKLNGTLKMNFVGNMFEVNGATFTFDGGVLDGNGKGRIFDIYGNSNVTIKNATIQKATTEEFQKKLDNGVNIQNYKGGAVKLTSSTLNLEDVTFQENHSKNQTPDAEKPEDPRIESNGGAIYCIYSTINIKGGKFLNNYTGTSETLNKVNGEGGAIKVDTGSKLNIDVLEKNGQEIRTLFDGNHVYHSVGNMGGFQGGAIEVSDSVANINKADFVVKGGFDTGGAIKFESSGSANNHNKITNSTFKLVGGQLPTTPVPSTHFGISGGAIMSENAFLTISNTEFTMEGKPTVAFAGGFIDVAGGGEFNLYDSNLTGNGYAWNDLSFQSAKYGGGLAFENGSSTKAHIKNTQFNNFTANLAGGIIAVGHSDLINSKFGETTVDLLMENTTLNGARAYTFDANSVGAGMYIAEKSNVVIKGGKISDMSANYGGAIYNKGNLTLDDGAKIENNSTTYMAAGIYNDGYLNVHNAELKNNNKTSDNYFAGGYHQFSAGEHSGGTIYAKKDVIIGKDAVFSTGAKDDVRVIDNQSSIILSGPRNTVVNVSISEVESTGNTNFYGKEFVENAHRHVGYLVAKGLEQANLTATYKPAGLADYEATANDAQNLHYVSHTVDANKVADVNDHVGTGVWDNVFNPDNKTVVLGQRAKMVYHSNEATATLDGGVADTDPAGQKLEQVYTFYDTGKVSINNVAATELTKIDKEPALAQYDFIGWYTADAKDKPKDAIDDSKKYDFANSTFSKAWNPTNAEIKDILDAGSKNTLNTYAVYERAPEKRTIEVKKEWVGTVKENTVKVQLYKNGVKEGAEVELNAANQFAHKFENLLVKDTITQPQDNVYTVKEVGEDNGRVAYGNNKYKVEYKDENGVITITNKYTPNITPLEPATKSITVNKVWVGTVQETSVKVQLYKNGAKVGNEVELNAGNNFSHKFENLNVVDTIDQAQPNKYEVKEVGEVDGRIAYGTNKYKVAYKTEGNVVTITNTHTPDVSPLIPATKSLTVNLVWEGNKEASVKVQLYKNGEKFGDEVELNEGNNFSHKFENLKVVDTLDQAKQNVYEVKEVGESDGKISFGDNNYKVTYKTEGNVVTITNTFIPKPVPQKPRLPRTGYGAGLTSVVFTISAMGLGAVSYFKKRND